MISSIHMRLIVMLIACITVPALVACGTVPAQPQQGAATAIPAVAPANGYGMQAALGGQPCTAQFPLSPATSHPIRQLFANTIAVIVQGVATGLAGGVVQGITGSITNWFDRKQPGGGSQNAASGAAAYPQAGVGYAQPAGVYPQAATGFPQAPAAYPSATMGYPQPGAGCPQVAATYPQGGGGYPSAAATYPQVGAAYPSAAATYPQVAATYPPTAATYPQGAATYPPTAATYPQGAAAYPSTAATYPQAGVAYPPAAATYPPSATTYPPVAAAYPQTAPVYGQPAPGNVQPGAPMPAVAAMPADPGSTPYAAAPIQVFDPKTGQMSTGLVSDPGTAADGTGFVQPTIYAGLAYEVHLLGAGGTTTPVNAATYEFHTGDRFVVHFRPTLPGHLEVFNINPLGIKTRIDTADLAAGMMKTLGPYEFTAAIGDESLQLVLSPCQSPELLASTRDIIKVSATVGSTPATALSSCSMTSRSLSVTQPRDIIKVALDGSTSYALDPVSQTELSSGHLAPREITIVFHHR